MYVLRFLFSSFDARNILQDKRVIKVLINKKKLFLDTANKNRVRNSRGEKETSSVKTFTVSRETEISYTRFHILHLYEQC